MNRLGALLGCLVYSKKVFAQTSNGSFGLVTTDPVCVQCDYATVAWHGGVTPYVLSVSRCRGGCGLTNVGMTSTNQMKWHVNIPTGTQLWFQLTDGNSTNIYTNIVTVTASSDASCLNVTNPLVTDSSTSSSALPSTAFGSASSTAAAPGGSSNPNSSGLPPSHSSAGPIAGGVIAGVVALLLLLLLAFWWRRKSKRRDSRSGSKTGLDTRTEHNGMIVEPFLPDAQMLQSNMGTTDRPISRKNRNVPSSGFSSTHFSSSGAGPSATPPSSSTSQPAHEALLPALSPTSAPRKHTRPVATPAGPVQESDAGVRLMGGVTREEPTTLPPAYDNSWRE